MKKTNGNEMVAKLVAALKLNANMKTADGVVFHVNEIFGVEKRQDNGMDTVFIHWTQDNNGPFGQCQLGGMAGFWFNGKEMKVINFDSYTKPMCDLAGCSVKAIARLVGGFTNYDRKNPDTFEVMYL